MRRVRVAALWSSLLPAAPLTIAGVCSLLPRFWSAAIKLFDEKLFGSKLKPDSSVSQVAALFNDQSDGTKQPFWSNFRPQVYGNGTGARHEIKLRQLLAHTSGLPYAVSVCTPRPSSRALRAGFALCLRARTHCSQYRAAIRHRHSN